MYYAILLSALVGLFVATYIYWKKQKQIPMTCSVKHDCNKVVSSKYSTLFGIPNEILGILYYSAVMIGMILLINGGYFIGGADLLLMLTIFGGVGTIMSLYFTYIQAFVIKEWCDYCVTSAVASWLIFILELVKLFYQ